MTHNHQATQAGNALFLILIAVALFAALSYAITQSGKGGGGTVSKEKALLSASELMQYASTIQSAITRLKLTGGCTDTEISFEGGGGTDIFTSGTYVNASAPSDKRCHVFDTAGGGVTPLITSQNWGNPATVIFTSGTLSNTGSSSPELLMIVDMLSQDICQAVNVKNGLAATPQDEFDDSPLSGSFNGSYDTSSVHVIATTGSLCFTQATLNRPYTYLHVLLAR